MSDDREFLTFEQAEAMLPDGDVIHTFRNPGANALIGADWPRADVLQKLRDGKPELAGGMATRMGHGLVVHDGSWLYIATKEAK